MVAVPTTSVGRKLALWIGVPALVAALVAVLVTWSYAERSVRRNTAEEAAALADLVATSFTLIDPAFHGRTPSGAVAHRQVRAVMRAEFKILAHVRHLRVLDRDGTIRYSRTPSEVGQRLPAAETVLATPPEGMLDEKTGVYVRPLGGEGCVRCHDGAEQSMGAVQVSVSDPRLSRDVRGLFRGAVIAILLLFAAMLAAAVWGMRTFVTRPIARLTDAMRQAEKGDFLTRAKVERDDEIGRLASAFNSMLARITEMKVAEIEASREMESMQRELALKAELERRIRDLTLLFDVTRSLNSTLELDEILKLVTEMVATRLGFHQFSMMLLDESSGELVVKTSAGFADPEAVSQFRLPLGQGASGLAAKSREPVYIRDVRNDPRFVRGPSAPDCDTSLLAVPMVCREKLVGVLNFEREGLDAFSENDVMLLQLVGNQAAMAIVNARLYQETVELTLVDSLTGVFNRRHLFARLEMELTRAHRFGAPLSLIMIDLDHFKHLNDACGHPAGDQVLREVAELLRKSVRKVDTVARYGGEEFAILLPMVSVSECQEVAEKLRRAVERTPIRYGDKQPGGRITISLGVAAFPDHGEALEQLIDAADAALYASKRAGRNKVTLYAPGMEDHPGRERGPNARKKAEAEDEAARTGSVAADSEGPADDGPGTRNSGS